MYPRITTLIAATLLLSSEVNAWDWWWKTSPQEIEPLQPTDLLPTAGISYSWITTTGNWNTAANWNPNSSFPQNQDDTAAFSPNPTSIDHDITALPVGLTFSLGTLKLDISAVDTSTSIPTLLLTNEFTLNFNTSSGNALLEVLTTNGGQASYEINSPITLTSTLDIIQNSSYIHLGNAALHVVCNISGNGGINYMGPQNAIFNFTTPNTFSGTANITGGTVQFDYGGVIGIPGDLTISNTGAVELQSNGVLSTSTNVTVTGPFAILNFENMNQNFNSLSLSGTLVNTGTATLTLNSTTPLSLTSSNFIGQLVILNNGTLSVTNNAGTSSSITTSSTDIGTTLLTIDVAAVNSIDLVTTNSTFTATTGALEKTGAGTWQMAGSTSSSYPDTDVNHGTLYINGTGIAVSTIQVDAGATLAGPGPVTTASGITNYGTVSPTFSGLTPQTFAVTNGYAQNTTGTLLINVLNTHTGVNDKLQLTGSAALDGALSIHLLPGVTVISGDSITILEATGGVTGTFSTVTNNFPTGVTATVEYTPNVVFIVFQGTIIPLTPAELALNFFSSAGYTNLANTLFALNDEHNLQLVRRCMFLRSRFSPVAETKAPLVGLLASNKPGVPDKKSEQISVSRFRNDPQGKPLSIYVAPVGSFGKFDHVHTQKGFRYHSVGGLAGVDYAFTKAGVGAQIGYERIDAHVQQHWGNFDINNIFGRIYSTFAPFTHAPFFIDAAVGFGGEWYTIKRKTPINTAQGKPSGWEWDAYLGFGYDGWINNVRFTPLVALQSIDVRVGKYREHKAGINDIQVGRQHTTSLRSDVGLSVGGKLVRTSVTWLPEVRGYWQHEFWARHRSVAIAAGQGITSNVSLLGLDRNYGILGTEQRFLFADKWTIAGDYDFQWGKHQHSNNFLFELGVYF